MKFLSVQIYRNYKSNFFISQSRKS